MRDHLQIFASDAGPSVGVDPHRMVDRATDQATTALPVTWHDLVLYLIGRFVGATAAQSVARLFALQVHQRE